MRKNIFMANLKIIGETFPASIFPVNVEEIWRIGRKNYCETRCFYRHNTSLRTLVEDRT